MKRMGVFLFVFALTACGYFPKASSHKTEDLDLGSLIMTGFRGLEAPPQLLKLIQKGQVGGVVLYDVDVSLKSDIRNIQSPQQLKKLTAQLQKAAPQTLLVAIDQEGGAVRRLRPERGFPDFPLSAQELGQKAAPQFTRQYAASMAATLKDCGINLNLAPVVDINTNPQSPAIGAKGRSFAPGPEKVITHARAFIQGHRRQNVLCALKHFPGHGSAGTDSHLGLTDVSKTWAPEELEPYRVLISESQVDMVMTAHVFNSRLDPQYPATLSRKILTGILREEIGFNGVIITDDMQMGAITKEYGFEEAVLGALQAGADILLFSNNLVHQERIVPRVHAIIHDALERGELSREKIQASIQRVHALRQKQGKSPQ